METFTHTVNGAEIRFAHLTLYDVFGDPEKTEVNGLLPVYRERLKERRLANLIKLGFSKEQQLVEMESFDNEPVDIQTLVGWIKKDARAVTQVLAFSFGKANERAALPELAGEDGAIIWKLLAPLGIVPSTADPEPGQPQPGYGEPGGQQNPTIPPTYSVTAGAMAPTIPEP